MGTGGKNVFGWCEGQRCWNIEAWWREVEVEEDVIREEANGWATCIYE